MDQAETDLDKGNTSTTGSVSVAEQEVDMDTDFNKSAKEFQSSRSPKQYPLKPTRKVNNVWAEVQKEEELEETLKSFEEVTTADRFKIFRGVESYDVGPKRRTAPTSAPSKSIKKPKRDEVQSIFGNSSDEEDEEDGEYAYETDSSISSGGMSEDSYARLRTLEPRKKVMAKRRIRIGSRTIGKPEKPIVSVDVAQPQESTEQEIKPGQILLEEKMSKMDDDHLAFFMAKQLKEPKEHLFVRAMQVLKREVCLRLFRKTMKIERAGGLQIKTQTRRRSPGGVFLYLLRNDKQLDQMQKKSIFEHDIMEFKNKKKRGGKVDAGDLLPTDFSKVEKVIGAQEQEKILSDEFHQNLDEQSSYQLPKRYGSTPPSLPKGPTDNAPVAGARQLVDYSDLDF